MTDVPHRTFHSLEKNVLETPSASPSYDFLLKKLPPFWLERHWRVSNLLLMKVAADLQKQTVVGPKTLSGLLEFTLPLIFSPPYRQRQHSRRNNRFPSIATGENLTPRKIYPTKQFRLPGKFFLISNPLGQPTLKLVFLHQVLLILILFLGPTTRILYASRI